MKRKIEGDSKYNKTYELMIEWFWMMLFVGVSYFEGTLLPINRYWVLLFSFHLIDDTGWFQELMKRMGKIWKVIWVFFIPLICVFGVFDEMVVPVIVWVFPTDSHEQEHIHDRMRMSYVKTVHSLWLWMRWNVWWKWDDYWTPIPLTA